MENKLIEIKQKAVPILKESGIIRSSIFGSYVRGEQREDSDIDLLVEYPKGLSLFDVAEIKYKLEDALGKNVDLVDFNRIKPRLKPYILSEQRPIL
ncbi:MAG: nucleotidyltransferase family protein [Candidatus Roizmanbacteria bacterium]|nr:nucleotidyltransferase family protein [Candidatus Roizmanbacteria bacterium]